MMIKILSSLNKRSHSPKWPNELCCCCFPWRPYWLNCSHYSSIMPRIVITSECISLPFPLHLWLRSLWASLSIIKKWQAHPRLSQAPDGTQAPSCTLTQTQDAPEEWQEAWAALISLHPSLTFQYDSQSSWR